MSNERHYYRVNVSQSQPVVKTYIDWSRFSSSRPDLLRLEFKLFKSVQSVWVADDCEVGIIHDQTINMLKAEDPVMVTHTRLVSDHTIMRRIVSGMHVPEDEQPSVIKQVFHGIKLVLAEQRIRGVATMPHVLVDIYDVTLKLQNINDDQTFN